MKWSDHSVYTLANLFKDESYEPWADSVKENEAAEFSEELDELLSRLAGVVVSEFSFDPRDKDKLTRLMELAALAGRRL